MHAVLIRTMHAYWRSHKKYWYFKALISQAKSLKKSFSPSKLTVFECIDAETHYMYSGA